LCSEESRKIEILGDSKLIIFWDFCASSHANVGVFSSGSRLKRRIRILVKKMTPGQHNSLPTSRLENLLIMSMRRLSRKQNCMINLKNLHPKNKRAASQRRRRVKPLLNKSTQLERDMILPRTSLRKLLLRKVSQDGYPSLSSTSAVLEC
jgi:hypothetical protein